MSGEDLAVVAEIGKRLLVTKLFATSIHSLWIYDYFLTLGDEIKYAWSGRRSWRFALFIVNRYIPALHILYKGNILFNLTKSFCRGTTWELMLYMTAITVLAQMTVASRVYAVTGRNNLHGGALSVLIAAQFGFGVYFVFVNAVGSFQPVPEINLDAYRVCFPKRWKLGELVFAGITVAFDLSAFLIILVTARGSRGRHGGIPSILDTIMRDATVYFLVMFVCQSVFFMFLFFAPIQIQLMPGVAQAAFLPIMASRLMISLSKALTEPKGLWSHTTGGGRTLEDESIRFCMSP